MESGLEIRLQSAIDNRQSAILKGGKLSMETLIKDIRYGVRSLAKRPGFTAIAILTLAIGIGACTAIFSVVDGVLLRPLPYPHAEQLVQLREVNPKGVHIRFAEPNFLDVRARSRTLE